MERLLEQTLAWAAREVPWYARRLRGEKRLDAAALRRLPFLTKDEAVRHQGALLARGVSPVFEGVISSGTTPRDRPLRVPRTEDELAACEAASAPPTGRLVLEVRAVHHGLSHLAAREGWLRVPWTYSANAVRLVEDLLSRPQPGGRRITDLLINAGALMPLTVALLEKGRDPRDFGLEAISTTSFRLSPWWKAHVERRWGARVWDNYSLSEIPTPALECGRCGFNHWLSPPLFAEVVDPATQRPLSEGTGALALTTLVPFVQAMPLLRYWTGDLVELGPSCAAAGARGIRFRGRLGQSLVRPTRRGGEVLVAAQDAIDFLEGEPLVARHAHPCETLGVIPDSGCGAVKLELSFDGGRPARPRARVELAFDPVAHAEASEDLGRRFGAHLLEKSPALARLERSGRGVLTVDLVGPGTLKRAWTKW